MEISTLNKNNEEIVLADEILRKLRRRIVKSFLDVIVMAKLNETSEPMDPHDVLTFIHQEFGVQYSTDSLYAILSSSEKDGLIKSEYIGGTKRYSLTDNGKKKMKIIMHEKSRILNLILDFVLIEIPCF